MKPGYTIDCNVGYPTPAFPIIGVFNFNVLNDYRAHATTHLIVNEILSEVTVAIFTNIKPKP